ncbi:hypothetical protein [Sporosarcina sp. A2]|uniref:hypothetical protein n=1 Tax=Sporosarcina sp. A2 TaxID=3393449 RepID=UPI003D7A8E93
MSTVNKPETTISFQELRANFGGCVFSFHSKVYTTFTPIALEESRAKCDRLVFGFQEGGRLHGKGKRTYG